MPNEWDGLEAHAEENMDFYGPLIDEMWADVRATFGRASFVRWPRHEIEAATLRLYLRADATAKPIVTAAAECHKGCHYCCIGQHPHVTELELWPIATYLNGDKKRLKTVFRSAQERMAWSVNERNLSPHPCPLLHEGACSIYPFRPLQCRAWTSTSAAACATGDNSKLAYLGFVKLLYSSLQGLLMTACQKSGLLVAGKGIDFVIGLKRACDHTAFAQWVSGHRLVRPKYHADAQDD